MWQALPRNGDSCPFCDRSITESFVRAKIRAILLRARSGRSEAAEPPGGEVTTPASTRTKKPAAARPAVQEVRVEHLNELSLALTAFPNGDFGVGLGRRDGVLADGVDRFNEVADMQ